LSAPWQTRCDFVSAIAYDAPLRLIPKAPVFGNIMRKRK
jgi:hypothetical protein